MKKYIHLALCLTIGFFSINGTAQSCGNDSLYKIPYKDTYAKSPLVAENTYRIARPNYTVLPKDIKEARIL